MKERIARTFEELWEKQPYGDITVSMICNAVPVSRTAFYRHFKDKKSIVQYCVTHDYEISCMPIFRFHLKEKGTACFFAHIAEKKDFYIRLYQLDDGILLFQCLKAAYRLGFEKRKDYSLPASRSSVSFDPEILYEYACSGIAAVVIHWIRENMRTPIPDMARDLYIMMSENLSTVRDRYT